MGEVDEPLPAVTYADCLAAAAVCLRVPCPPGYLVMPIADFILSSAFHLGFQPYSLLGHRFFQAPAMVCTVPAESPFGRAYSGAWLPSKSIH